MNKLNSLGNNSMKISVIVPVYNMADTIGKCIENVRKQSLTDIEVICVNDGSNDGSLNIIKKYCEIDKRIKVITTKNRGSGPARNTGMMRARGEYIAFMDADDYYPSIDVLEVLYNTAKEKCVDICGGSLVYVNVNNKRQKLEYRQQIFMEDNYINIEDYQWCFGYQRFIYSRQMLIDRQIMFKNLRRFQDPPFMLEAMLDTKRIYGLKKATYCYRVGYKKVSWNEKNLTDYVRGVTLILQKSNEYNLMKLHAFIVNERVKNGVIKDNIKRNYKTTFWALRKLENEINYEWIKSDGSVTEEIINYAKKRWLKKILDIFKI